ncbi:MAG: hypothetical protein HC903_15970 [Methylacidiphilales bacterium]|nr:hypothetical protein [Candidatus Methylacidiphilales bacterium]NJR17287.1 hypothetical protein [Calothrix sp. CSU_2_0]
MISFPQKSDTYGKLPLTHNLFLLWKDSLKLSFSHYAIAIFSPIVERSKLPAFTVVRSRLTT